MRTVKERDRSEPVARLASEAPGAEEDTPAIDWSTQPRGGWEAFAAARKRFLTQAGSERPARP